MGAREYDPTTGTFISHDPVADPAVPNGYSYTPANPLGHTDPRGSQAVPIITTGVCAGLTPAGCAEVFGAAACLSTSACRDAVGLIQI